MKLAVAAIAAVCVGSCAPAERTQAPAPPRPAGYEIALSPELDRVDVVACIPGVERLAPQSERARALVTHSEQSGDCTRYGVDLRAASETADLRGAIRFPGALLASPDLWLWRPDPLPASALEARFALPSGSSAALAWPGEGEQRRVPESTFLWASQAAFGRFDRERIAIDGKSVDVALLGDGWRGRREQVIGWIRRAAEGTAATYGRFPVDATLLVIAGRGKSFGLALRGGGPTVVLRVGAGELEDDATALHELLHLGIPHVDLEHAWLFEGIVEYETRRARARAGTLAPERAWWELADGFERGRRAGTGRTLAEESAAMHRTRAYWRVYWAGAAMALETDVELRKCGTSLQAALARLAREHAVAVGLSLADVIAALDRGCPSAPLAKISARELARSEFPEVAPLLAWLGVRAGEAGAELDDRAPGSAVRDAIIPRQGFRSIIPRQGFRSIIAR